MEQPLSGIKVLEFSSFVAVPGVGRMMATWGADVIKVEGITGEVWRYMGGNYVSPSLDDENPLFTFCNANKRMISLDMRQPEALEVMKTLAKSCDVFLTNIRPASLKRQGLDYDSLKKINPGIIFADFTAYGDVGPDADEAGFDVASLWGRSGLMIDSVPKGCVPPRMTGGAGDLICSGYLLSGILSALIAKKQSGKGTRITSSLYWNGLWCASTGIISTQYGNPYPKDTLQPINPLVHTYLCKDQEWFCPGIQNYDLQHDKVLNAFGLSEYMDDPRFINVKAYGKHKEEFAKLISEAFLQKTSKEWEAIFLAEGLPYSIPAHFADRINDVQAQANHYFDEVTFQNGNKAWIPAVPVSFSEYPSPGSKPVAPVGADTKEVLLEHGYTSEAIDALLEKGAIK